MHFWSYLYSIHGCKESTGPYMTWHPCRKLASQSSVEFARSLILSFSPITWFWRNSIFWALLYPFSTTKKQRQVIHTLQPLARLQKCCDTKPRSLEQEGLFDRHLIPLKSSFISYSTQTGSKITKRNVTQKQSGFVQFVQLYHYAGLDVLHAEKIFFTNILWMS